MGKEWYWSTKPVARGDRDCNSKESSSSSSSSSSPGCMGGMFHYLHFHHLLFTGSSGGCCRAPIASSTSSSSVSLPQRVINGTSKKHKGLEAPRNSLELDRPGKASSTTWAMDEQFKDVPVAIEVAPPPAMLSKSSNNKKKVIVEEGQRSSQAETPRTPSLVARLMGLEVSAEQLCSSPPSVERRRTHERVKKMIKNATSDQRRGPSPPPRQPLRSLNCNILLPSPQVKVVDVGSRSLPESPRASSVRCHDVERRLSLQVTSRSMHEFNHPCEVTGAEYTLPPSPNSRKKDSRRYHDENKSPRSHFHGREMLIKQVKEKPITRTRDDEIKSKSRRNRPPEKGVMAPTADQPPLSTYDNDAKKPLTPPREPLPSRSLDQLPSSKTLKKPVVQNKCKKADFERFTGRIKKPTNSRSPPTLASLFQSADSQSQRNPQDMCNSSSSILPSIVASPRSLKDAPQAVISRPIRKSSQSSESRYLKAILEHARIARFDTSSWYSRSLPVDPIIFHRLELKFPCFITGNGSDEEAEHYCRRFLGPLGHRWNRKLMFHLVQEILTDLSSSNAAITSSGKGDELLRQLVARIESFPAADCRVLGDIDALVAGDLAEADVRRMLIHPPVVEEAGEVVLAVEREILDGLLAETTASVALPSARKAAVSIPECPSRGNVPTESAGAN